MGDITSWVGLVIAAFSLGVAIIAIYISGRAQKVANSVQLRLLEIEEQREKHRIDVSKQAELRAELRKKGNSGRLYIQNSGAAEARNMRVELDGRPLSEHLVASPQHPIPDLVGPYDEISCFLTMNSHTSKPPFKIRIIWDDESGADRNYRSTLTW